MAFGIALGSLVPAVPATLNAMSVGSTSLPIAIGFGSGGETRRPLGLAVAGGLIISQFVTLYLTPVIYTYLDGLAMRWRRLGRKQAVPVPATVPAGD